MASYLRPSRMQDALAALRDGPRTVLAGGTDFFPARVARPADEDILDITGLAGLDGIAETGEGWRVGALARWSDLAAARLPPAFDGLKQAALQVGGVQIQNAGTICGNVCNASPAADGMPNLLVLDAAVELRSAAGRRVLPLADFVTGNRSTARQADEMVSALLLPAPPAGARGAFRKLGARRYLVISIVMVAVVLAPDDDGGVAGARIAVGACSPVARRLPALEAALAGRPIDADLAALPDFAHLAPLSPIDDIRGSGEYRLDAALTLLRRALADLAAGWR